MSKGDSPLNPKGDSLLNSPLATRLRKRDRALTANISVRSSRTSPTHTGSKHRPRSKGKTKKRKNSTSEERADPFSVNPAEIEDLQKYMDLLHKKTETNMKELLCEAMEKSKMEMSSMMNSLKSSIFGEKQDMTSMDNKYHSTLEQLVIRFSQIDQKSLMQAQWQKKLKMHVRRKRIS